MRRHKGKEGARGTDNLKNPTSGQRSAKLLAVVESGSAIYCLGAFLGSAFMLFVLLSSAFGGGAPAISLPLGPSEATEVSALHSRIGTPNSHFTPDAHFTGLEFSAWGLSPVASLLYYSPNFLTPLAHAVIALSIYKLARSAQSPRPFRRSARRALTLSAVTIAFIGTATQVLHGLGTDLARSELLRATDLYTGRVMSAPFDWSPVFIGMAIGILVIVFRAGERFQDEADGLI